MSEKSRVILYADLRKKISDIDAYSFDEKSLSSLENADKILEEKNEDISVKATSSGIMRNTFSMSIDELIKEHDLYDSKSQQKEAHARYNQVKKSNRVKRKVAFSTIVMWSSISVVLVVFIILLVLILTGVI